MQWASVRAVETAKMTRTISLILLALGCTLLRAATDVACAQIARGAAVSSIEPSYVLAQSRPRRARTRIRVMPTYPYRLYSTDYPVPYKYEYPGPGAVRQCRSWLAAEDRASGSVIVPRMRCRWE
jgi:hypothetical protein